MTVTDRLRQPKGAAGSAGGQYATDPNSSIAAPVDLGASALERPEVFTVKYETIQEKTEAFTAEIEQKVAALDDDREWQNWLNTMSKFHRYSPNNQLLIQMQCPHATRVAGFRKWKDEFGRQVRKGEKAIAILTPVTVKKEVKDSNGNVVMGKNGKPRTQRVPIRGKYSTASVFDISQTDGDDLPEYDMNVSDTPPPGFEDDLKSTIESRGYEVVFEEIPGSANGYTDPVGRRVVIDSSLSEGSRASTLAHELGHIDAGHTERGAEYHSGPGGCRGEMEVEAEGYSYAVLRMAGMDPTRKTGGYVKGWASTSAEPDVIKKSMSNITKAVHGLVESGSVRAITEAD